MLFIEIVFQRYLAQDLLRDQSSSRKRTVQRPGGIYNHPTPFDLMSKGGIKHMSLQTF